MDTNSGPFRRIRLVFSSNNIIDWWAMNYDFTTSASLHELRCHKTIFTDIDTIEKGLNVGYPVKRVAEAILWGVGSSGGVHCWKSLTQRHYELHRQETDSAT